MKVTGIIAEYNPFHNGHKYHIENTKKITDAEGIVCIMSGNFVQRGLPSIIDKWTRTEMALLNGADLVIELPCIYSLSSAEFFSMGAISLLDNIGVVDSISFGSEAGDISMLLKIAQILSFESEDYKKFLRSNLNNGNTYPRAVSNTISKLLNVENEFQVADLENIINNPNNILGIEYLKAIIRSESNIKPFTIKRKGAAYNSDMLENEFSSATSIRNYINSSQKIDLLKNQLPQSVFEHISNLYMKNYDFANENKMLRFLKYKLLTHPSSIQRLPDISEGLHNKIIRAAENNINDYDSFIKIIKSKRYTYSRISRLLCQLFIGFDQYDTKTMRQMKCPYARILGFNNTGRAILKSAKKNSSIPLITKIPRENDEILGLDLKSTAAYSLLNSNIKPKDDYYISPIML